MPADKEFQNVYNQIRLLKGRGVGFSNLKDTKTHLMDKSYFNLVNGFETLLLDDHKKTPKKYTNKQFDDFIDLYDFDMKLSNLIFTKISEFETKLKTSIAYFFCKSHCSTLAGNNNYVDINYYKKPSTTDGPAEYVNYFEKHKLFRKNYYFEGNFRGEFNGEVIFDTRKNKTKLVGDFSGRFGSISLREVKEGTLTFFNSDQPALLSLIHSYTTVSKTIISLTGLNISSERIYGLNYIDDCKIKFNYINEYKNPPFWVTIKPLMLNDILILMYGLDKRTFNEILQNFNLKPNDKEKFLNSIAIIKELRNTCAHFELINRFRTSNKLSINAHLISELDLKPMRSHYIVRLFDALKVLNLYVDMSEVKQFLWDYYDYLTKTKRLTLATKLFDRMGNFNIYLWM
ncbi:Abi family protein [Lysinibacillus sp. TE18511]